MNDKPYDLNDEFIKEILFKTEYVLDLLDLEKSDIIAFYRQDAKIGTYWEYCKDLYLTKDSIIIVELKDIKSNDANIKVYPIKNLTLECAEFKLFANKPFEFDKIKLELDKINLGDKLDGIVEKPVENPGFASFNINYLDFKKELIKLLIKNK